MNAINNNKQMSVILVLGVFAVIMGCAAVLVLGIFIGKSPSQSQPVIAVSTERVVQPTVDDTDEYLNKILPLVDELTASLDSVSYLASNFDGTSSWDAQMFAELDKMDGIALKITMIRKPSDPLLKENYEYLQKIAEEIFLFTGDTRTGVRTGDPYYLELATNHMEEVIRYSQTATEAINR